MTELTDATFKGKRVLNRVEPTQTIQALAKRAEALQRDIAAALNLLIEEDRESCPGVPGPVLKGLRTARFCHGYCPCSWVKDEANE